MSIFRMSDWKMLRPAKMPYSKQEKEDTIPYNKLNNDANIITLKMLGRLNFLIGTT